MFLSTRNKVKLMIYVLLQLGPLVWAVQAYGQTMMLGEERIAAASPITIRATASAGFNRADNNLLIGFLDKPYADRPFLALTWSKDGSGWFPVWNLQLHLSSLVTLLGVDAQKEVSQWLGGDVITLCQASPVNGKAYEIAVSYDAKAGALSLAVTDSSTAEAVFSGGFLISPFQGGLYAAPGKAIRVLDTVTEYVPVGAHWFTGVMPERNRFTPTSLIEAKEQSAILRLVVPGSAPSGHFKFTLKNKRQDIDIAEVVVSSNETVIPLPVAKLPLGKSTLRMQYIAGNKVLLANEQEIVIGDVTAGFNPAQFLHSDSLAQWPLLLQSKSAIEGLEVSVHGTVYKTVWDIEKREYREEIFTDDQRLYEGKVDIAAGEPTELLLRVPLPSEPGIWRIKANVQVAPDVRFSMSEGNQIINTYEPATIKPGEPYTIAILPDTQQYSLNFPDIYTRQTQWIAENAKRLNIGLTLHMGDITENNTPPEWENAYRSMHVLDGVVPYVMAVGAHDYRGPKGASSRDSTLVNQYFTVENARKNSGLVEAFRPGRIEDTYSLFELGNDKYLVITLNEGPMDTAVEWANKVVAQYPDRKVIFVTHNYLWRDGSLNKPETGGLNPDVYGYSRQPGETINNGQQLWDKFVSKHANMFMVWCGHIVAGSIPRRVDTGDHGNTVYSMLADYQHLDKGGSGYMVLMTFNPDNTVKVRMFSPYLGSYLENYSYQGFSSSFVIDLFAETVR